MERDRSCRFLFLLIFHFNSHAHVERDARTLQNWEIGHRISTHTLTWSVTIEVEAGSSVTFISTHTLTWSVTCKEFYKNCKYSYFNSHAHVERDVKDSIYSGKLFISTHTLTWSVTNSFMWSRQTFDISTHTLTWSVTQIGIS